MSGQRGGGAVLLAGLRGACRRAVWADRFVRTTYLGMTSMHLLLGAASTGVELPAATLAGLLLVALGFHVHIFLANDLIDLEVDATQPRRAQSPLVRGLRGEGVSRRGAVAIAGLGALLAIGVAFGLSASRNAWLALAAAFVGIGIYNVWGKRCPLPPVTDAIQGLGWWGFVLFGVYVAAPAASFDLIRDRTLPLLAFSLGFTVLITGIHGGLRDLVNDRRHRRTNTSIFLGARPVAAAGPDPDETAVRSSWGVVAFAYAVLAAMFVPCVAFVSEPAHFAGAGWQRAAAAAMALLLLANAALLWRVVKPLEPRRDAWMSGHSVFLLVPPALLYLLSDLPSTSLKAWIVFLFAAPLAVQERFMQRLHAHLERYDAPVAPAAAGALAARRAGPGSGP